MQDEIAFCCLETTSFPVANISCCTVTFLAYIAILNLVYTQLTISALNPSIFIVTTVMNANSIAGALSKSTFNSTTLDIVQKNGSSSLAIESTWNSSSSCGKMTMMKLYEQ